MQKHSFKIDLNAPDNDGDIIQSAGLVISNKNIPVLREYNTAPTAICGHAKLTLKGNILKVTAELNDLVDIPKSQFGLGINIIESEDTSATSKLIHKSKLLCIGIHDVVKGSKLINQKHYRP